MIYILITGFPQVAFIVHRGLLTGVNLAFSFKVLCSYFLILNSSKIYYTTFVLYGIVVDFLLCQYFHLIVVSFGNELQTKTSRRILMRNVSHLTVNIVLKKQKSMNMKRTIITIIDVLVNKNSRSSVESCFSFPTSEICLLKSD